VPGRLVGSPDGIGEHDTSCIRSVLSPRYVLAFISRSQTGPGLPELLRGRDLQQYTSEKPSGPLELRIYSGADTSFLIYEDDGATMQYPRLNESSTIALQWEDGATSLHVAARESSFHGMLSTRTLRILLVREGVGVGMEPAAAAATKTAFYTGAALVLKL
jgi:hypothetical protein